MAGITKHRGWVGLIKILKEVKKRKPDVRLHLYTGVDEPSKGSGSVDDWISFAQDNRAHGRSGDMNDLEWFWGFLGDGRISIATTDVMEVGVDELLVLSPRLIEG